MRYDGSPIEKKWISVSHSHGNAQAQDNQASQVNFVWIWLAYLFGFFSQTIADVRRWKRESFGKWADEAHVFRNDKPWFAFGKEWSEMQYEAIQRTLRQRSFSSIEQTPYYRLLSRSKPTLLSEEHWAKLQVDAGELLMARFSRDATMYANIDNLVDLVKLKQPEGLSHAQWTQAQESLVTQLQHKLSPTYANAADLVRVLEPDNSTLKALPNPIANRVRERAQERYVRYLEETSRLERDPSLILTTTRFDLLTEKQSTSLKKNILGIARMTAAPSSWSISHLKWFISNGRPSWMPQDEFESISEFVRQGEALDAEHDAVHEEQTKLASARRETETLKERVLTQLDVIDRLLTSPDSIDKIEDYAQPFAPGNLKNLKIVASLLRSAT